MAWISQADLERYFAHAEPTHEQRVRILRIRNAAAFLAEEILTHSPGCADQSRAIRCVREALDAATHAIVIPRPEPRQRGGGASADSSTA